MIEVLDSAVGEPEQDDEIMNADESPLTTGSSEPLTVTDCPFTAGMEVGEMEVTEAKNNS